MQEPLHSFFLLEGQCAGASVCPLTRVRPGATVCIKKLAASPELSARLRELGFCEEQKIKLLASDSNYICQVCNARLGISQKLAEAILVENLSTAGPNSGKGWAPPTDGTPCPA